MVAAIGAAAALGGAAISASGAKSAAKDQSAASDRATQAQMMAQAQQRSDLAPWVQSGVGANAALQRYLGIGGAGSGGVTSLGLQTGLTPDQVRQQLMSRYTTTSTSSSGGQQSYTPGALPGTPGGVSTFESAAAKTPYKSFAEAYQALGAQGAKQWQTQIEQEVLGSAPKVGFYMPGVDLGSNSGPLQFVPQGGQPTTSSQVDEAGLNAAIAKYYEEQNAQNAAAESDPTYGSLLRAYRDGQDFSFTGQDLKTDPGYQFGLDQGTQGIDRAQASRGNFLSGAAIKEATRFNEDYAGTKFNEGFNRAQSTWNTNLGAYNDNRNRVFNFLNGVSTLGQNSAAGTGAAAIQVGNNIGSNALASGNAQAAAGIASGNALQSGINSAVNSYNSNNLNSTSGWNNMLASQGGGYSGYTGYTGTSDPIANLNTKNGWTG